MNDRKYNQQIVKIKQTFRHFVLVLLLLYRPFFVLLKKNQFMCKCFVRFISPL